MDLQAKLTAEMEGRLTDKETSPTIKSTPFSRAPPSRDNTTYASGNTIIHSSSIASTQVTHPCKFHPDYFFTLKHSEQSELPCAEQ